MGDKNKSQIRTKFSIVTGCILTLLFIAVPCSAAVVTGELNVGSGYETQQIDYPIVLGTLNLYPGAEIYSGILALGGCTINFYGGQMSQGSYIIAFNSTANPKITVHGRNFAVNGVPCDPSATSFTLVSGVYQTLTGNYENGDHINLTFYGNIPINLVTLASEDEDMEIDIKPGDEQNNINLNSKGVVPVAVLTSTQFDAASIDPATARFAGAAPAHWSFEDVDGDGDDDIIFHFKTQLLGLNQDSTEATLTAQTAQPVGTVTIQSMSAVSSGSTVTGTDEVRIVSSKEKSKK